MKVEWTRELSTGVEWQDAQHRELFDRINRLLAAIDEGKGHEEVGKIFKFLSGYIAKYLGDEEIAMKRYRYEGYESHKESHDNFIRDFTALKEEFEGTDAKDRSMESVKELLVDWWFSHITTVDMELGAFLVARG